MRQQLARLLQNLGAGVRLAFFLRVRPGDFRLGLAEFLLLLLVSALLDFGSDWVRYNPGGYFSSYGAGNEVFTAGLLLITSAVLGLAYRQHALAIALPIVVLSALPPVQVVQTGFDAVARWGWPGLPWLDEVENVVLAWLVIVLVRSVAVLLPATRSRRWAHALVGAILLAAPLWLAPAVTPTQTWWRQPAVHGGIDPNLPNPASEAVLTTQSELLDNALAGLEDERPGTTDVYFVAFGGYASEDVFRKDVEAAQRVMDERWDTKGRSVVLLNNQRTLLQTPIATVSNLRETLAEFAVAMNTDEDVAMIYLASHGRPQSLSVVLSPLELDAVTPTVLRNLLDEAGITWRIIVISACYSGSFIPALQDDHTLVITAGQADRTSFGCGFRSDGTYFGEAFFSEALAKADSIPAAFELAKRIIAEREVAEHASPPSNPQIWIGPAMQEKLKELERGNAARRAGRLVCDAPCAMDRGRARRAQSAAAAAGHTT